MDIGLPDGSVLSGVPDGTSKQQIIEKLHQSGNPNWETMAEASTEKYSPTRFLTHAISEPLAALFTGSVAAPVSGLAGMVAGATGSDAADAVEGTQQALTYHPKSKEGQAALSGVTYPLRKLAQGADYAGQKAADVTGSPGVGAFVNTALQAAPALLTRGAGAGADAAEVAAETAAKSAAAAARASHFVENSTGLKWNQLSSSSKAMMTSIADDATNLQHLDPAATERVLRAQSQPVPVPVSKGQAMRDSAQITREEGIRKSDAGAPLRKIQSEQDQALFENLNVLRGEAAPGSKVTTSQQAGAPVQAALRRKMQVLEGEKNRKYAAARKAGETSAPVDMSPLEDWLKVPVNARNAGFLKSAIEDYRKDPSGSVTINHLEEIRKEAVAQALGPPSPAGHYAGEAIGVIDGILDKSGGSVYREARAAHRAIKEEFDRQGAIRQMVGSKGKTDDRKVALEDTLETTVIRGSNEDLAKVKKSLLQGGTEQTKRRGTQAWRDLQSGAISYLREKAGGKRQIKGENDQEQFNGTFLDALHDLDHDGKLDTLFGKNLADRVRLLAKTVHDVRTTPAMRISGSDSVPRILNMLEKASNIPLLGHTATMAAGIMKGGAKLYGMGRKAMGKEDPEAVAAARTPLDDAAAKSAAKQRGPATARGLAPTAIGGLQGGIDLGESQP